MPEDSEKGVYRFAGFTVDAVRRRLLSGDTPIAVTSKALDTLLFLIVHRGATVTKGELMNAVWSDSAVEENNLTQQISTLRRALGERPHDHRFIVTVPGRGYCFVAALDEAPAAAIVRPFVPSSFLDASALRGYGLAIGYVVLIALSFVWSALQDGDRTHSLAVLNFKVSASRDEFIGNGISETLRARLGSVQDLTVMPAPAETDAINAGRRLRVDTVVTGSVQRDNDRIRVAVEMLDVVDGRIVWGKTFDATGSAVFDLQDAIAGEVARALKVSFTNSSLL